MGHTYICLAASEDVLTSALRTAWELRIDKNAKTSRKYHAAERGGERIRNIPSPLSGQSHWLWVPSVDSGRGLFGAKINSRATESLRIFPLSGPPRTELPE